MRSLRSAFAAFAFVTISTTTLLTAVGRLAAQDEPETATPPDEGTTDEGVAATAGPKLEFSSDKYKEQYEKGVAAFEAKDYAGAKKALAAASSGIKDRQGKGYLKAWANACQYLPRLQNVDKLIEQKKFGEAHTYLLGIVAKAQGTPAMGHIADRQEKLEALLYQPLEGFDRKTAEFSEKFGKTFLEDPGVVFKGKYSLRWQNTTPPSAAVLKIKDVPANWATFAAVEFYVQSLKPVQIECLIMTGDDVGDRTKPQPPRAPVPAGAKVQSAYMSPISVAGKPGVWQRIYLPLDGFQSQGKATLAAVQDLRLQIQQGRQFDMLVDEFRLVRKDPAQSAQGGRK